MRYAQGHDGYPNDRVFLRDNCSLNATVFDPYTRLMKGPDKHDLRTTKLEKTGDNQYKLTLPDPQDNEMNPGDYFTVSNETFLDPPDPEVAGGGITNASRLPPALHALSLNTALCFMQYPRKALLHSSNCLPAVVVCRCVNSFPPLLLSIGALLLWRADMAL